MSAEPQPVWMAFPTIPWGSIGWRMGRGEDYWHAWVSWFRELSVSSREEYRQEWPEPDGWQGFYAMMDTGEAPARLLERQERSAEAELPPAAEEEVISDYDRIIWLVRQHMKRAGSDELKPDEAFALFYDSPDRTRWRLSVLLKGRMTMTRVSR